MDDSTTTIQLRRSPGPVVAVTAQRPPSQGVCVQSVAGGLVKPGDLKRHKCLIEMTKPIEQQKDAVQCGGCHKWFHN